MYVNNVDEFIEHTKSHIENVNCMTGFVLDEAESSEDARKALGIPEGVDIKAFREKVEKGMKAHDAAKLNRKEAVEIGPNLERFMARVMTKGISDEDERRDKGRKMMERGFSVPEVLYAGYAGNLMSMAEKTNNEFFQFVDNVLNEKDEKIIDRYLDSVFTEDWEKEAFRRIEGLADKVDRGLNPISVEEFGRKMTPASDFMKKETPEMQQLIRKCDSVFEEVCPQSFYHRRFEELSAEELTSIKNRIASTSGVHHLKQEKKEMMEKFGEISTEMYDGIVERSLYVKDEVGASVKNKHQETLERLNASRGGRIR